MMIERFAFALLMCVSATALAEPEEKQIPFPVGRSQILRAEKTVYYIEGRQTIPKGVEISCQKDVYIKARGENATLVVEGSLQVHGVGAREVIFEGITVEPARTFEDIHLDMCIFRGSGGLRTPKDGVNAGKIFTENVKFEFKTFFDVTLDSGSIDLSSVLCSETLRITVNTPAGKRTDDVKIKIRGCVGIGAGFDKGMHISGASDMTIRTNRIDGDEAVFVDNDTLIFDGNRVSTKRLEFRQTQSGNFSKTKLQKCDIYCEKLIAFAPLDDKKTDKITVDKCWFKGLESEKDLRKGLLEDRESTAPPTVPPTEAPESARPAANETPKNGALFTFKKINARALELAGALER